MNKYKYVFIVLVYRNTAVLEEFFKNFHIRDSRVVVVNSFFDDESLSSCEKIAKSNEAIFIPIKNKGYGYGNNVGIQYAIDHFAFEYLIVSNSDIIIKELDYLDTMQLDKAIIAPDTRLLTGKRQNPDTPYELPLLFGITNIALKFNIAWLYLLTHIYTRVSRELFILYSKIRKKNLYKIYAVHGSFFIITEKAIKELIPLFHDKMFLYNEEWYLAVKAKNMSIPVYYSPKLKVLHLEGGSTVHVNNSLFKYNKQSYAIFYQWMKSQKSRFTNYE